MKTINHNLKRDYTLETLPERPADPWPEPAQKLHTEWWQGRIARQREIDNSIAAKADFNYLYDKPYDDNRIGQLKRYSRLSDQSDYRRIDAHFGVAISWQRHRSLFRCDFQFRPVSLHC